MNIDLHIHTKNSDGHFTTKEILTMAENLGIEIISITDHDSVKSYYDIINKNLIFNGMIIKGIELSFRKNGRLYDVLGYNIDIEILNEWLQKVYPYEKVVDNQKRILNEMKNLYHKLGIKFDENLNISVGAKSEAYNLMKRSVMSFDCNKDVAPEFWEKNFYKICHTNIKSKYYIDETKILPNLSEAIEIIHKAGGVAILAHSGAYGFSDDEMKTFINDAVIAGIDGLELKYNCHDKHCEEIIMSFVEKYNLLTTGGSDFHGGVIKPNVKLGKVYGDENISILTIQKLLNSIKIKI